MQIVVCDLVAAVGGRGPARAQTTLGSSGDKCAYILTLLRTKNRKEPIFSTEKLGSEMLEYVHRPILTDTKQFHYQFL